jgi:lipase chaperone LimK
MGEITSFEEYARRKLRLERVAVNEAAVRRAWEQEEARRLWQALWRSHPKRRRTAPR